MDALLTPEQVADRLHLALHTVYVWLRDGRLPGIKVGHRWRVRQEDVDAYIDNRRDEDASPLPEVEGDLMDLVALAEAYASEIPDEEWERVPPDLCEHLDCYAYERPEEAKAA